MSARVAGAALRVTSVYVPNGRELGHEQYDYKLKWFASLADVVADSMAGGPQVIMGDFNVALHDADVWDIDAFAGVDPRHRGGAGRRAGR